MTPCLPEKRDYLQQTSFFENIPETKDRSIFTPSTVQSPQLNNTKTMVLILDGNPEIGALVKSKIGNLICLRHLVILIAVTNMKSVF